MANMMGSLAGASTAELVSCVDGWYRVKKLFVGSKSEEPEKQDEQDEQDEQDDVKG